MNRYGRGTIGNPSKATATTQCQKCLKRGHYTYECKAPAQERPYVSRPSRTQQLLNPKLVPKLTTDVPNDLLRKKGVADEQLAKVEAERGRKRERQSEDGDVEGHSGKRMRSASSVSSASVSTISTSQSRSPSPRRPTRVEKGARRSRSLSKSPLRHRLRSLSISRSPVDRGRNRYRSISRSPIREHIQRPLSASRSPIRKERLRSSSRSRSPPLIHERLPDADRKRRRTSDVSRDSYDSRDRIASPEREDSRSTRRRFRQVSPPIRGRRTESRSPERGRRRLSNDRRRQQNDSDAHASAPKVENRPPPPPRKERSLSPFSKRVALTQAMNRGQ